MKQSKPAVRKKATPARPVPPKVSPPDSPKPASICEHCMCKRDDEEMELITTHGLLRCPQREREGCFSCMPAGRNCLCPECEGG